MKRDSDLSVRSIALALIASMLASLGLALVYLSGGQPQIEGALLGVALGGLCVALVLWAKKLLPGGPYVEERAVVPKTEARGDVAAAFEAGAELIERRRLLSKLLGTAIAAFGLAALFPIRSLGIGPGRALFHTEWRRGARLVRPDGSLIRPDELPVDGVLTVFPEFHTEAADSQALLIRLPPDVTPPGPKRWSADGLVAFSKICTHAGCPVGLYEAQSKQLLCPCHQSAFAVLQGAKPVTGPATRPLPQLPLGIDRSGFLVARGDFSEPVGPGFWDRGRGR